LAAGYAEFIAAKRIADSKPLVEKSLIRKL